MFGYALKGDTFQVPKKMLARGPSYLSLLVTSRTLGRLKTGFGKGQYTMNIVT